MPYIGQGLQQGRRQLHTFTATASQTTFSVAYSPGYVDVYQNGILLAPSDFTATNGTTVVLAVGAAVNDEITIIAQHLFSVADVVSASQGGTFAGDVTMTGNLTVQGTTITVDTSTAQTLAMGDADKIILGTDNDLQMYHSGTTGYIDNNTGALYIRNNVDDDDGGNIIIEAKSGKASIVAQDDEGVRLYYNDVEKLETTNTGVTVTGTVVSNGITSNDDIVINSIGSGTGGCLQINNSSTSNNFPKAIEAYNSGISAGQRHQIMLGKDGSNYDTASLSYYYAGNASTSNRLEFGFWGAGSLLNVQADGNVGIGTNNPAKRLDVFLPASTDGDTIRIARSNGAYYWHIGQTSSSVFYISNNDGNQHLTIAADGDIGIGTTPYANARLTIGGTEGGGYPAVLQFDNNNTSGAEFFMLATDTNWSAGSNKFIMGHGAPASSNADVTIDSNGYVGINTTSPQRALHIHDHAATGLHITNSQSGSGANDGFSQYIRDDNQATELMVRENSYLGFGTNNTLRARIESGGEFFWPEIGTRGDITFPICSISNNGSSNRYLHAQFQAQGGDMLHIHFRGYEYIGSSMREGSGGGYIYNTGGQQTIYAQGYSGHCVQVYQTTTNRVELVIDTGTSQTGNRWGSYVFFGGTDTITSNSPLTLVQYGWSSGTGRLYSS